MLVKYSLLTSSALSTLPSFRIFCFSNSFFVPKDEIVGNDYDLSINKYKKTEYVPIEYPSTAEIMADLHELEMKITTGLAELEEML